MVSGSGVSVWVSGGAIEGDRETSGRTVCERKSGSVSEEQSPPQSRQLLPGHP